MKSIRIGYFTLMAGFLLYGLYSGGRIFYVLFFFQLFILVFCASISLWTCLFTFTQTLQEAAATKGETLTLNLNIYNEKPFPFTMMRIRVENVARRDDRVLTLSLMPGKSAQFELPIHCVFRGEYSVGMTVVEVRDILGLLTIPFNMTLVPYYRKRCLLVLPRVIALPATMASPRGASGLSGEMRAVSQEEDTPADSRLWQKGDQMARINWKLSMRTRMLYTRRLEAPRQPQSLVFIDTACAQGFEGDDARYISDLACECACSLVYSELKSGRSCAVVTCERGLKPREEAALRAFPVFNGWLAGLEFTGGDPLGDALVPALRRWGDYAVYVITRRAADAASMISSGGARSATIIEPRQEGEIGAFMPTPGMRHIRIASGDELAAKLGGLA